MKLTGVPVQTTLFAAGLIAFLSLLLAACGGGSHHQSGTWEATGNLNTARACHTATLLLNGRVLVVGGQDGTVGASYGTLASAELYDSFTGLWVLTGTLGTARSDHTATLLPSGKVLVAGGHGVGNAPLDSVELYDPVIGTWERTGSLATARMYHTATLLPDGKVLVAGGYNPTNPYGSLDSVELYDPSTGTWATTSNLATQRSRHSATLLPNGTVLVVGGRPSNIAAIGELYDPVTSTWTLVPPAVWYMNSYIARHTATLLPSGIVLVAGGYDWRWPTGRAFFYDPASRIWTPTADLVASGGRAGHTATLLPNGKVLATGGTAYLATLNNSAELYDPTAGTWTATGNLATARVGHTATLLPNDMVLVTGGAGSMTVSSSAELYW